VLLLRIEHDLHNYQCLELTSWAYPAININSCLLALTNDISTPADIARSALETIVFCCFLGYISALTYYLLLLIKWISLNVEYDSEECFHGQVDKVWVGRSCSMCHTSLLLLYQPCCFYGNETRSWTLLINHCWQVSQSCLANCQRLHIELTHTPV